MSSVSDFFKRFVKAFTDKGFVVSESQKHMEISDDLPALLLFKQIGTALYMYRLYNGGKINSSSINAHSVDLRKYAEELIFGNNCRMVIMTSILITAERTEDGAKFLQNTPEVFGQVYELYYNVVVGEKTMLANEAQPNNIIDISQMLGDAFNNENTEPAATVGEIYEKSAHKSVLKPKRSPFLVYAIMAVNVLVFALCEMNGGTDNIVNLLRFGAMNWSLVEAGDLYRLFSAIFLHSGIMHLGYNCLSLYIFGERCEKHYGHVLFLLIYLLSGLSSNFFSGIADSSSVMVGASGAIFGLAGAVGIAALFTGKTVDGLGLGSLIMLIIASLAFGFLMPNVGNVAHVTGLITGSVISTIIGLCGFWKDKTAENE